MLKKALIIVVVVALLLWLFGCEEKGPNSNRLRSERSVTRSTITVHDNGQLIGKYITDESVYVSSMRVWWYKDTSVNYDSITIKGGVITIDETKVKVLK